MPAESCRHIMTNGEQCGSPRMREADFCYFHGRMYTRHRTAINGARSNTMVPVLDRTGAFLGMEAATIHSLDLGLLEDRTSVQVAISTVLNALASGNLPERRAAALLYGLQLASNNCRPIRLEHSHAADPVEEVVDTPEGVTLAPADRVAPATLRREETFYQFLQTEGLYDDEEGEDPDTK